MSIARGGAIPAPLSAFRFTSISAGVFSGYYLDEKGFPLAVIPSTAVSSAALTALPSVPPGAVGARLQADSGSVLLWFVREDGSPLSSNGSEPTALTEAKAFADALVVGQKINIGRVAD